MAWHDGKKIAKGVAVVSALASLITVPVKARAQEEWSAMTGHEISQALTERSLTYGNAGQTFFASGGTVYRRGGRESSGVWRVEQDQYCSLWPPHDLWSCYHLERLGDAFRFVGTEGDMTVGRYVQ